MRSRHSQEGERTDGSVRAALLSARLRWQGRHQAYWDSREHVAIDYGGPHGLVASTPFLVELRESAGRAAEQHWATLEAEQAALVAELWRLAAAVVRYGHEETVHHLRFWRDMTAWDGAVRRARKRLGATVHGLSQIQEAYWSGLSRRHRELVRERPDRSPRPRPVRITSAGLWPPTSVALLTGWDEADSADRIPTVLDQAIEIVVKMAATPPKWHQGEDR
jgi:hypothetical protein